MKLAGKKVIIIGGSSGIGLGVAKAAVAKDAQVTIASRSKDKLENAKKEIDGNVKMRIIDVRKEENVKAFFDRIESFDHLVTTTHAIEPVLELFRPVAEVETKAARLWMETKYWGQYFAAKYGAHKISSNGSITLTAGNASRAYVLNHATVAATNAAIGAFGWLFAQEIAPKRVNVVSPGLVKTPTFNFMTIEKRKAHYQKFRNELIPVRHVATPEEISLTYVYLMECDYHNGDVICVDGGFLGEERYLNKSD